MGNRLFIKNYTAIRKIEKKNSPTPDALKKKEKNFTLYWASIERERIQCKIEVFSLFLPFIQPIIKLFCKIIPKVTPVPFVWHFLRTNIRQNMKICFFFLFFAYFCSITIRSIMRIESYIQFFESLPWFLFIIFIRI